MDDAGPNTPKPQGELCQVSCFRENNSITGEADLGKVRRTKKFTSYDSLRFEKERRETFIDWPVRWLKPEDLACDGFYYLRTADHCACVFCRGIVGVWGYGDIPRKEHRRHFPHCPFINGEPVGNIPYAQSMIMSQITPSPETAPLSPLSMGVCDIGRPMPGSYPQIKSLKMADHVFRNIGLPQHTSLKRKEFSSQESREKSFIGWPERVKQVPKELAEAGFFYCGLSDHVRCYHCGNGLRNWEKEADPWEEHARAYPECNYVLDNKGQEFIDEVRREEPPYLRSQTAPRNISSSLARPSIFESDLDPFLELDIVKATLKMGYPADRVRLALRKKLEQTGLPFFSLEACTEAVLQYMDEENRPTLRESSARNSESEAASQQGARMQSLQSASERQATESSSSPIATNATTTTTADTMSSSSSSSLFSSAGLSSQHDPATSSIEESPTLAHEVPSLVNQIAGMVTSATSTPTKPFAGVAFSSPHQVTLAAFPIFNNSPESVMGEVAKKVFPSSEPSVTGKSQLSQDPAVELKMRDSHICKMCMDAEKDTVFLPCTHMATCSACALVLTQCPICSTDIKYTFKPIRS